MSIEILKNDIKKGSLNQVYLFYGPENYLIEYYLKEIIFMLIDPIYQSFNLSILEGKEGFQNIINSCETAPVMSNRKLVIVKNSGLFGSSPKGNKEKTGKDVEDIVNYINNLPQGVYIIFVENEINKNTKMCCAVKARGLLVEFSYRKADDLVKWITKVFKSYKVEIRKQEAMHMISICDSGMTDILNEIKKLIEYVGEGNAITFDHIEELCVKSIHGKVFEMLDAITQKNPNKAYKMLEDMLILKEPIQKISVLAARHFRIMFFIKHMKVRGCTIEKIAGQLGLQPFIVNKYLRQCEKYELSRLKNAMRDCLAADRKIKTGLIDSRIALEAIIAKYSA